MKSLSTFIHPQHHSDDLVYVTGSHWVVHSGAVSIVICSATLFVFALGAQVSGDPEIARAFLLAACAVAAWGAVAVCLSVLKDRNRKLIITTSRVIRREGFFSFDEQSYYLNAVDAVGVRQSMLGVLLDFGDVVIDAGDGRHLAWRYIKAPKAIQREIGGHREHEHGE